MFPKPSESVKGIYLNSLNEKRSQKTPKIRPNPRYFPSTKKAITPCKITMNALETAQKNLVLSIKKQCNAGLAFFVRQCISHLNPKSMRGAAWLR
jgi:hypothetical protein